jgi:hypothetical protein
MEILKAKYLHKFKGPIHAENRKIAELMKEYTCSYWIDSA